MVRKQLLLVLVIVFICMNSASAQRQSEQLEFKSELVCVFLEGGSFVVGELLDETKTELEVLIPGDASLFILKKNVEKIRRTSEGYSITPNGRINYDKGFYCAWYPLVLFYGRGRSGYRFSEIATQFQVGRHHNKRLSYGLMVGISETNNYHEETDFSYGFTAAPVAALFNYNINVKGPRVYVTSKLGYAFKIDRGWNKDINSGMYGSVGLGIAMPTRSLSRFTMELERTYIQNSGITGPENIWDEDLVMPQPFATYAKYVTLKLGIALRQ